MTTNEPYEEPDYHQEAPLLYSLRAAQPFQTPDGFFDAMRAEVSIKCADDDSRPERPFSVPDDYFEAFSTETLVRSKLTENATQSLATPDGFFEGLEARILERTLGDHSRQWTPRRLWPIAAAAAAAVIAAVFLFFPDKPIEQPCATFACLWEDVSTADLMEEVPAETLLLLLEDVDADALIAEDNELTDQAEAYLVEAASVEELLEELNEDELLELLQE